MSGLADDEVSLSISEAKDAQKSSMADGDVKEGDDISADIPQYGFKVDMTYTFPEKWKQCMIPRLNQIPDLIQLFVRYLFWWLKTWIILRKRPFIDISPIQSKRIYGVPLGGIGSGTIGRGFRGQFCRYQMTPGMYSYDVVDENQFILSVRDKNSEVLFQKVLTGNGDPKTLSSWDWSFPPENGSYVGLYPRAWYIYNIPEVEMKAICRQVSPVIPHNYTDSCIPGAVFVWNIKNESPSPKEIALTFTFKNGIGKKSDVGNRCCQSFKGKLTSEGNNNPFRGISMENKIDGLETTFGIACMEQEHQKVTHMNQFNVKFGSDLWDKLLSQGSLDIESCYYEIRRGEFGSAVCATVNVDGNSSQEIVFSLVWDQPVIKFKQNSHEGFKRRYSNIVPRTNQVGDKEDLRKRTIPVKNLSQYCLSNFRRWEKEITDWQKPIISDRKLPDFFKSAIFNELYFISDGGSQWVEYDEKTLPRRVQDDVRSEYGRFAYLEAHEYRMFNTYDVHFYSSICLTLLWPKLQQSLQYDYADAILFADKTSRTHLFDGTTASRKVGDSVPHDLGDPCEDPYIKINSYNIHEVSDWKDLNLKFVLQVFRDWKLMKDSQYLNLLLPICDTVMSKSLLWDKDDDGLIENSGSADQTYDTWVMKGPSAYCGGLWLASLYAIIQMLKDDSNTCGKENLAKYERTLQKGKKSFEEKLWTGSYYKFDCSDRPNALSIHSDQLCGHWFMLMSGENDAVIFPEENVKKALKTLFENNVMKQKNGEMGAANGMMPNGTIDTFTIQSEETWTGVTYALAATMMYHGMEEEAFKTAKGLYTTVYEKIGLGFETPEAITHRNRYRALGYMRPLSILSILHAWNQRAHTNQSIE